MTRLYPLLVIFVFLLGQDSSTEVLIRGQASGNTTWGSSLNSNTFPVNIRYLPELNFNYYLNDLRYGMDLGAQSSLSTIGMKDPEATLEPYRAVLRLDRTSDQIRLGLQKINFGPGQVLRLLQWFDEQDVKDPLALSPGVWAGMYRKFFGSGYDFRFWGIYDHNDPSRKLYEKLYDDVTRKPVDLGGRLEIPAGRGTAGITLHTLDPLEVSETFSEIKGALDGRWDLGVGIWFESFVSKMIQSGRKTITTNAIMAGADYTFGFGNGLYTSFEVASWNSDASGKNENVVKALSSSMNYPFSLNDAFSIYLMAVDQADRDIEVAVFAGWRHTFGNWMTFVSIFDYPDNSVVNQNLPGGRGVQMYLAFNH